MNIEEYREYCLAKAGTSEDLPFDEDTLVFKVLGKMFALTSLSNTNFTVNLKCDPDKAIELREEYDEVKPGYHMNKKHWNTVTFDGDLGDKMLKKLIDHSYELVVSKMTKKQREELKKLAK